VSSVVRRGKQFINRKDKLGCGLLAINIGSDLREVWLGGFHGTATLNCGDMVTGVQFDPVFEINHRIM
jgi:hypothetical protein